MDPFLYPSVQAHPNERSHQRSLPKRILFSLKVSEILRLFASKCQLISFLFFAASLKANDEKSPASATNDTKKPHVNNNLLIAATSSKPANATTNEDGDVEAFEGGATSDGDSADIQRKKEIIMAKQLERRQQLELIRIKREEEKARKAEELRCKEEELANKKQLEKTRKETIYQAYIDKKKQLEEESQCGSFGHPSSLMNAKKFHSTHRLKQQQQQHHASSSKLNTAANLDQQQFKQNMIDQFDQASIFSDRSSNQLYGQQQQQAGMIKSKWTATLIKFRSILNFCNTLYYYFFILFSIFEIRFRIFILF